jgi:hypothetical protein
MEHELVFRLHVVRRMFERSITVSEVRAVIAAGEIIRDYPDDRPYPSRLILGWPTGRPLHVVAADNPADATTIIITAYEPTLDLWEVDFKHKRKP